MDLEENIRIAANVAAMNELYDITSFEKGFIAGAKSQEAKDYWYNEFKRQKIQSDSGQDQSLRNQPLKPSECFNGKSEHQMIFGTGAVTDEENELWQKQVIEPTYQHDEFVSYRKEHPEEEISYKEWANRFIFGDGILEQTIKMYDIKLPKYCPDIKYVVDGSWDEYQEYLKDNPDRPISFDNWKYMVEHYEKPELISKRDIIGHVDHCKSTKCVIIGVGSQMIIPEPIESIVPIADVIPEEIISKQEFLKNHDKAVEHYIVEESYKESHAWNIKKQKKVSHKRKNKRK